MNIQEWAILFWKQILETPLLQWIAVIFGVSEVLLARANKIWLYPTGIIAITLSIYNLYEAGLYAECLLNLYYIVMSVYGWWFWVKKKHKPAVRITHTTPKEWGHVLQIVAGGFVILFLSLKYFTDSTVPVMDAWVSATAWAGMWLLAKRKVENWILLNVSNAFAIPLLIYKGLPLYGVLTLVLFIVAVVGYFDWKKQSREETVSKFLEALD